MIWGISRKYCNTCQKFLPAENFYNQVAKSCKACSRIQPPTQVTFKPLVLDGKWAKLLTEN